MLRIKTKNIREKPARGDGCRVLVMTLWPRGIKKAAVDLWLKDLGSPRPLIRAWKSGRLSWPEMRKGYEAHLRTPAARRTLRGLAQLARRKPVTLLCQCQEPARCHRSILQDLLRRLTLH